MLDIGSTELLLLVVVTVVVLGPKELPRALYKVGQFLGKTRAMTRHFRSGIDDMMRQAELEELEKKWAAENARIMAAHPPLPAGTESSGNDAPLAGADHDESDGPVAPVPDAEHAKPTDSAAQSLPGGGREGA